MQRSTWLVALMMMAAAFAMLYLNNQQQTAPPREAPEVMLQRAQDAVKKAGSDKKAIQKALQEYSLIVKYYPGTEFAAQARLETANITAEKLEDLYGAHKAYKEIVHDFPPASSKFGAEAERRVIAVEKEMIAKNSGSILYKIMDFFVKLTGSKPAYSYAVALILVTLIVKALLYPLTHAQFKSMKEMQRMQPLVKQLQEKYKGNQKEMGEKMMALYKEHGISPFASCLPLLAQWPVLILLYQMVRLYEMKFASGHFLWIGSEISHKYPALLGTNLAQPDIPLLVLYVASMFVTQMLTVVDPTQAEQQKIMGYTLPVLFAVLFRGLPSAFIFFWLVMNILSTIQQYYVLKKPAEAGGTPSGPGAPPEPVAPVVEAAPRRRTRSGRSKRRRSRFDGLPAFRAA